MPLICRVLARNQDRTGPHAPVYNVQQHVSSLCVQVADAKVIQDEQLRLDQRRLQLWQGAIEHRRANICVQIRGSVKHHGELEPAGLGSESTCQPCFSDSRRAQDDEVLVTMNPLTS